jgi:hypothetical protein
MSRWFHTGIPRLAFPYVMPSIVSSKGVISTWVSPFLQILYLSNTISQKISQKELQLLLMVWLTVINSMLFVLWNLIPFKNLRKKIFL